MENNENTTVSSGDSIPTDIDQMETEEIAEEVLEENPEDATEELTEEIPEEVTETESTLSNDILYQLELQNLALEQITAIMEESKQTIWEKPIEDYTPTEGILLIMMFLMLGVIIFKLVGGIICLK